MENFTYYNPTKLIFGKEQVEELKNEVPKFGNKVLLVYGGGSIKRNGLYDKIVQILKEIDIQINELPGVEPNPRLTTVQRGVEICKAEKIDFILAVGGGSVIDCVKAISVGAKYDGNPWDIG
jgi:alcohol dehydrogenase YqhD (iron-dependent ADH family)